MSEKTTIELDQYEAGVIVQSLNEKRNQLIKEQEPTDAVDEVLLKVINVIENPPRKRRGFWRESR